MHGIASSVGALMRQPTPQEAPRHPTLRLVERPVVPWPPRVLLVDDNYHHRIPIRRALRDRGHSVLYAADGASGEAISGTSQLEIDALVACAEMKRMSGFELARRVRRMRPDIRVLLMSRKDAEREGAHCADEPGCAVIEEPFTPEELCHRLTDLLAFPRNEGCAEPRLDAEDGLDADQALTIGSKNENRRPE